MASTLSHLTGLLYGARLQTKSGATGNYQYVRNNERKGLARQYWPESLEVMAELPSTSTGKIQKFRLRDAIIGAS